MIVFLDRQHCGKPGRWGDVGTHFPGASDDISRYEIMLTAKYIWHAELALRDAGIHVVVLGDGSYKERHDRVNAYAKEYGGKCVYLAAHINAGGGDYSTCFYDYRSIGGNKLGGKIGLELSKIPELSNHCRVIQAKPNDWTKNAYYTIKGASPVAICFEPFFIDCTEHARLLEEEGLAEIGRALATGIINYLGEL